MRLALLFLCFLLSQSVYCQRAESSIIPPKKEKKSSFNRVFEGEPGRAALYSLIIPGGGQFYNRSYLKIPLVIAGEGYAIYNLTQALSTYNRLNGCHTALANNEIEPTICDGETSVSDAFQRSQSARSNKETAWLMVGGAHLLNVLDAFIHRHLINFDTSDDISFNYNSSLYQSPQISLIRITIPLN